MITEVSFKKHAGALREFPAKPLWFEYVDLGPSVDLHCEVEARFIGASKSVRAGCEIILWRPGIDLDDDAQPRFPGFGMASHVWLGDPSRRFHDPCGCGESRTLEEAVEAAQRVYRLFVDKSREFAKREGAAS